MSDRGLCQGYDVKVVFVVILDLHCFIADCLLMSVNLVFAASPFPVAVSSPRLLLFTFLFTDLIATNTCSRLKKDSATGPLITSP